MIETKIKNIKKELEKFNRYKFYEEPHIYTYVEDDGSETQVGISVTTLGGQYEQEFDEDRVATFKSKKDGIPKEDLIAMWHFDRDFACCKGTHTHAYNEFLWRGGELYDYDKEAVIDEFGYDVIAPVWDKLKKICESFYKKFKDRLIPIGLEQIVGSRDYDIAGAIDFLAYSKKLDTIIIIDYKTNKKIEFESYKDKKMLYPLNHIPDCNYYHYCLQLAIYKFILEYETKLKIYNKKWLIWMNEANDDFVLYECENLDNEAKKILEARRKEIYV